MRKFSLIQRGTFQKESKGIYFLIGEDGVISLDYMGSAEFEFGAIPKAFRRLMYHYTEYEVFHTEIYTPEHDELMVFCRKNYAKEIIPAIQEFVEKPYYLQEYSELEKVPKAKKEDTSFMGHRYSNFWWCIDIKSSGDWMAFLQSQSDIFTQAIKNDYQDWWLKKTSKEREEEYNKSLHW